VAELVSVPLVAAVKVITVDGLTTVTQVQAVAVLAEMVVPQIQEAIILWVVLEALVAHPQ
jgi:hypothetical protein